MLGDVTEHKYRIVEDNDGFYPQRKFMGMWFNMLTNSAFCTNYFLTYYQAVEFIEKDKVRRITKKKIHYV